MQGKAGRPIERLPPLGSGNLKNAATIVFTLGLRELLASQPSIELHKGDLWLFQLSGRLAHADSACSLLLGVADVQDHGEIARHDADLPEEKQRELMQGKSVTFLFFAR